VEHFHVTFGGLSCVGFEISQAVLLLRRVISVRELAAQADASPRPDAQRRHPPLLFPSLHRLVAAARLGNSSSDGFSVMTSCLLHSNYSSTDRPMAWLRCDNDRDKAIL